MARACRECGAVIGAEHDRCYTHRTMNTAETPDYDPRYDRAQTVDGAKARYVDPEQDYTLTDFERDVERILTEGENPDKRDRPTFEGQVVLT